MEREQPRVEFSDHCEEIHIGLFWFEGGIDIFSKPAYVYVSPSIIDRGGLFR